MRTVPTIHREPFIAKTCIGWSLIGLVIVAGCSKRRRSQVDGEVYPSERTQVVAQGQILPADGITEIMMAPGEVVQDLLVEVGERVEVGQRLATMRSAKVRTQQLAALRIRRKQAVTAQQVEIQQAEQQIAAAELQVESVMAQRDALAAQEKILELAEEQVRAAEKILERMQSIADDRVTGEFVGQLELERQRIEVRDSRLKYLQQQQQLQAKYDELKWSQRAAEQNLQAAKMGLAAARDAQRIEVIDAEIAVLETQMEISQVTAPRAGTVVAIHASAGESAVRQPLLELADTSRMVCEVEVHQADAERIHSGLPARITSPVLTKSLEGRVVRRNRLVGQPQLRPIDPLAPRDFRAVNVIVEIDEADATRAANWLQLQVDVNIEIE